MFSVIIWLKPIIFVHGNEGIGQKELRSDTVDGQHIQTLRKHNY